MAKNQQTLFQKLTKLFKSGPIVKRKIRALDTTVALPDTAKSSATLLFQKSVAPTYTTITANAYNLSERMMRYQDFVEMEYCLHGDTQIAVPGGYKKIKELSEECVLNPDKSFLVYAYDHNLGRIIPAWGKQARQTRVDHAYTVTFDNGQKIIGTPNHRLMKRDGSFCKIEDLKSGDAMMPFYRRDLFSGCKEEGTGYRWIYTMDKRIKMNGWVPEHRVIGEMIKGSPLLENEVVHHRNFVKHDNRPENLKVMTNEAHQQLHAEVLNGVKWSEKNSEWIEQFKIDQTKFMSENNPVERKDITFGRILEIAERVNFNSSKICEVLDTNPSVIKDKLYKHGYQNFETFTRAYNPTWYNTGCDNSGKNNSGYNKAVTFDRICSLFSKGMSKKQLVVSLNTTDKILSKQLSENGFKNYTEFSQDYENLKVSSVEYHGVIPLFDLTVDGYKNFATDTVISHNTPEIASSLDIYADETCAQDDRGRVLHVYSENEKVKEILEELFYDVLNVEFNLRSWVRNLVKYGDFFLYCDVSPDHGVLNVFPIPVNEIIREENYDPDDPLAVRYKWVTMGNKSLENWEIIHFRLLGNDAFLPYGSSIIEAARRIWRQLILIEDAMLVYRVVRAPERRVFYIDVANIPPENVPMYVEEQRKNLRSNQVVDRTTGRVDLRYNPLCNSLKTLIKLQDGRTLTLANVINEWDAGNNDMWAYSVDLKNKKLVPGKISWAGITRRDAEIVRVHIDDSTWYDCTPDHKWLLRNGEYKAAESLLPGDALMPLYVKSTTKEEGHNIIGYEKIYDPFTQQYILTHRNNVIATQGFDAIKGNVVHHADFDKKNNNPSNLVPMTWKAHFRLHGDEAAARNRSPSGRLTSRNRMKKTWAEGKINSETAKVLWAVKDIRKKRIDKLTLKINSEFVDHCMRTLDNLGTGLSTREHTILSALNADEKFLTYLRDNNPEFKNGYYTMTRSSFQTRLKSLGFTKSIESLKRSWLTSRHNINDIIKFCELTPQCTRSKIMHKFNLSRNELSEIIKLSGIDYRNFALQHMPGNSRYTSYKNHKVVRVERLSTREDTGCITVDVYHNFAAGPSSSNIEDDKLLNSFIYLHNSVDEDYFIPVRGGESGTRIDTLAGGQNTAAVEDVAYIQKKLFSALKIPRAYLGYDESLSCVVPETPVDLLDGRTLTVEQIKGELDIGKPVWVYSVDKETLKMKPGRVVWAGPTRKNASLVRVTIDNGMSFDCTPDHKWMLRDGSWCQAGELKPDTSLMPVERRLHSMNGGQVYEQIFDPASEKWKWTHRLVADNEPSIASHPSCLDESVNVIHHIDVNRFNNNPENLIRMGFDAHRQLHADDLAKTRSAALFAGKYNGLNNGWAKQCRDKVSHLWNIQTLISWCLENHPTSKRQVMSGYGLHETQLDRLLLENSLNYQQFADSYVHGGYKLARSDIGGYKNINYKRINGKKGPGSSGGKFIVAECVYCNSHIQFNVNMPKKFCSSECHKYFGNGKKAPEPKFVRDGLINHKVISVEVLTETRDTWCIEVAGTHTFGLSKSVIISNSKATLAQEDIRFSRTISVIQKTIIAELNKVAIIHLYSHGFDDEDLQNFVLRLTNPSTIAQQQKLELWRSKFEIAGSAPEGQMSKEFIRKEIWGLSSEQCEEIDNQRLKEKLVDQAIEETKAEEAPDEASGDEEESDTDDAASDEEESEDLFAGDDAGEDELGNLLLSADNPDDDEDEDFGIKFNLKDIKTPVKARKEIDRIKHNRARIRHTGPAKLHMPDWKSSLNANDLSMTDPYGMKDLMSIVTNPLKETKTYKTRVGPDVMFALRKMSESPKFQANTTARSGLLAETLSVELEDDLNNDDEENV